VELRRILDAYSTSGLLSVVEPKAVDHMILETLKNWHIPLSALTRCLKAAIVCSLAKTLQSTVREWRATKLFDEMQYANQSFVDRHFDEMTSFVNRALCVEHVKPITREERLMDRYVAEDMSMLEFARLKQRN
jgi:hypothetical protein